MFRPLPGWNFRPLSLADDAGGSPSVICVSKPLWAVVRAVPLMDVGSVAGWRPTGLSDSDDRRTSEEGSSPVDIVTVPEPIEHSAVGGGGSLIRLLLVSRWRILGNPGIGRMVGRAIQTTVMPSAVTSRRLIVTSCNLAITRF